MAPNVFCSRTTTPNIQPMSLRTIFSVKKNRKVLEVMVWPPQSPDLNIIESVWDYMKRQKDLRKPTSTEDLWLVLQDVWNNLPAEFLQKLVQVYLEELMLF